MTADTPSPSERNAVVRLLQDIHAQLAYYDYLLPGDFVPDPPWRKRWFRWGPAFKVTDDLIIWAGQIARKRSLMDLKSAAEQVADLIERPSSPRSSTVDEATVGWQPIETAPKDGTYVLFAGRNFDGGMAVVHWDDGLDWWTLDDGKNFEIALRDESKLTHWRPLPEPPASLPSAAMGWQAAGNEISSDG